MHTMMKLSPNTMNSNVFSLNDGIILFKSETKNGRKLITF